MRINDMTNRTLIIPRNRCIEGQYGRTSRGHCAAGWLGFAVGRDHEFADITAAHEFFAHGQATRNVAIPHDRGDEASVIAVFATIGITARYVDTATDEQILAAWRGESIDPIDQEFSDLMKGELICQ